MSQRLQTHFDAPDQSPASLEGEVWSAAVFVFLAAAAKQIFSCGEGREGGGGWTKGRSITCYSSALEKLSGALKKSEELGGKLGSEAIGSKKIGQLEGITSETFLAAHLR